MRWMVSPRNVEGLWGWRGCLGEGGFRVGGAFLGGMLGCWEGMEWWGWGRLCRLLGFGDIFSSGGADVEGWDSRFG